MRPLALVFDMDGLLLDTERRALDAFVHACDALGVAGKVDVYLRCIGTRMRESRRILIDGHGPDFPFDAVYEAWEGYHEARRREPVPPKPGAREMLQLAERAGIPCALATTTHGKSAAQRLAAVGLRSYFPVMMTGDKVLRGKPHPETYARAAEELGVEPARCWAFEDSGPGVRSASAAGCRVFQIPDLVAPDAELRALGHVVLGSLHEARKLLEGVLGLRAGAADGGVAGADGGGGRRGSE